MLHARALVAILPAVLLTGCPASAPSTGLQPTYTSLAENVLVGCSTQACHGGLNPAGNLSLEAGKGHAALVGVPPDNAQAKANGLLRVTAGDPDRSFLLIKLHPIAKSGYGTQMPVGGRLTEAQISLVRQWIARGAPND